MGSFADSIAGELGSTGVATGQPTQQAPSADSFAASIAGELSAPKESEVSFGMLEQQLQKNPDEVAKKRKLQERFDAPPEAVDRLTDQMETQARAQDFASTIENAPATRKFFEQDPERVALAADSVEDLGLIESLTNGYSKGTQGTQFLLDVYAGLQAGAQFNPEALAAAQKAIEASNPTPEGGFSSFVSAAAEFVGQQAQTVAGDLSNFAINIGGGAVIGAATGAAIGAPTGPGAGATAAIGAVRGAAAGLAAFYTSTSFKLNFAENYVNMVTAGHDPQSAYWTSIISGTINSLVDTAGASIVAKPFVDIGRDRLKKLLGETVVQPTIQQAVKRFFGAYVGGVASQVADETVQEGVNIALQKVAESWADADVKTLTDDEIKERLTSTIVETFKGMVLIAPVGPGARALNDMKQASERAKIDKEQTDRISKLTQSSKLFERDPKAAVEHVRTVIEAAAQNNIYVTADALVNSAQQAVAGMDPLNQGKVSDLITALGIDREELDRAVALGGDVKLSSQQYAKLLASPGYPALADHIRRGEDGMTPAEAKEFDDAGVQEEIAALQKPLPEDVGGQQAQQADGATAGGDQADREGGERQGIEAAGRGTVSVDFPLAKDKEKFAPAGDTIVYVAPEAAEQLTLPPDKPWRIVQQSDGVYDVVVQTSEGAWENAGSLPVTSTPGDNLIPLTLKSSAPPVNGKPAFAEVRTQATAPQTEQAPAKPAPPTPVELAEAELGLNAMFKTAAEAGMTPEQYRSYLIAVGQASEAGRKRKEERALKRRLKENSEQWKKEYETELAVQTEALSGEPVYAAFDGIQQERLNRDQVLAALGGDEAQLAKLPKQKGGRNIYTDKGEAGGLDLDTYAQLHDFAAGDIMLFQMMDRPLKSVEAARLAQKEMQTKHGHILSERQEVEEAIEALHNDTQGQMLALELNQLRQAQGQGRIKLSLLRQAARNTLQTMHLNGINPRQFYSTEQRLGRLAGKLLRKGDRATAAKAKFQQVLNFEMAKQSFKIQAQIEKDRKWLLKFHRDRSKWTDLPGDYLDHIRILLDNFNIETKGSVARGREIEAWLKAKKAIGEEIEIPARFLAPGGIQNYMDMTLSDWQSFVAKIRELHHKGVTERKLLKAQEKATIDERAAEVIEQANTNLANIRAPYTEKGKGGAILSAVRGAGREYAGVVLNFTTLLRMVDGWKDFGPAYTNIKGRIDQAYSRGYLPGQRGYLHQKLKQSQRIIKLFEAFPLSERKHMHSRSFAAPPLSSGKPLTQAQALSVILNSGNRYNIEAMIESGDFTQQDLQNIWNAAPKKYWEFAQSAWDYLAGFRPDIEATELRRKGFAPEMVEADAIQTPHGVYRGGYFPIKFRDKRVTKESLDELIEIMKNGGFVSSHTRDGHIKARTDTAGRKLLLDPFVLQSHVEQVIYDLEMGDALRDAFRILRHPKVARAFRDLGQTETYDALNWALEDTITQEVRLSGRIQSSFRWLRTGYTISALAWNLGTISLQPLGLLQSGVMVGHGRIAKATMDVVWSIAKDPRHPLKIFQFVAGQTDTMGSRFEDWNRDIVDAERQLSHSLLARYTPGKTADVFQKSFFYFLKTVQNVVDTITWMAAHQKGLKDFDGDIQKAKDYADMAVIRTQASSIFHERTAIERGRFDDRTKQSEFVKAFTVLASYFMAKTNIAFERTKQTNFKSPAQVIKWATDMAVLFVVEALLAQIMRGEFPDSEDDDEDLGSFILGQTGLTVLAGLPGGRGIAAEVQGFEGGGLFASLASAAADLLQQAGQGEADQSLRKHAIKILGIVAHLPGGQINRVLNVLDEADAGEDVAPLWFVFGPPRD